MGKEASLQIEMASKLDTEESKMLLKGSKNQILIIVAPRQLTYQN